MFSTVSTYFTDFYRLFYPSICGCCDQPLTKGEAQLCVHCRLSLPFTQYEKMEENPVEKSLFGRAPIVYGSALLQFSKGESTQQLLHNIKYNGQRELAVFMGRMMGTRLQESGRLLAVDVLMPVPLHPQKEQVRGYNQSALLVEGMAAILPAEVQKDNLVRKVATATQTRKSRLERWENVEAVFDVRHPERLRGKHIMLVDDVLTTGATIEACVQALTEKADCSVSVAVLATPM